MSEDLEFFDNSAPPPFEAEMSAFDTWKAAVTKPSVATFVKIAGQSGATTQKALLWVALASLVTAFFSALGQSVGAGQGMQMLREMLPADVANSLPAGGGGAAVGFGALICGAPLGAIMGVLFFAIGVALILWVAKLFGGSGEFEKLAYTFAAIMVPIAAVNAGLTLFGMIPFIGVLFGLVSFGVSIYSLVLHVYAVQAVTGLDTGKAAASVILPWLVIFIFLCCCLALFLVVFGAAFGDVFSQINQGLY
jgi:hypothetical protein